MIYDALAGNEAVEGLRTFGSGEIFELFRAGSGTFLFVGWAAKIYVRVLDNVAYKLRTAVACLGAVNLGAVSCVCNCLPWETRVYATGGYHV